jgi:branched-chain amino acid transport system substrate-binding protein
MVTRAGRPTRDVQPDASRRFGPVLIELTAGGRFRADQDLDAVPPGVLDVVRGAIRDAAGELDFLWREPGWALLQRVRIEVAPPGDLQRSALVRGVPCEENPYRLTVRELQVLTLIAIGLGNTEIAERVAARPRTVTTHAERILVKLGVTTRTGAAALALDEGLLLLPMDGGVADLALVRLGRALQPDPSVPGTRRTTPLSRRITRRPLLLGAAVPLSGWAAEDGAEMVRATQLAAEEINERGGVAGRTIEVTAVDVDVLSAESIERGMLELASRGADALTSGYFAHQDVAHEIAAEYGAPYLHAATLTAMVERVAGDRGRYGRIFQLCPSDDNYGPGFVRYLTDLHAGGHWQPRSRTLLVMQSAWSLSDLGLERAAALAEQRGWHLELLNLQTNSDAAWRSAAEHVRRTEPAAVLLGQYFVRGATEFVNAFLADPGETLVYLLYAPSLREFRAQLGDRAEGLLWATTTGTYSDLLALGFARRYRNRFGMAPGRSHAGIAYDRTRLLAEAWSRVPNPRDHRRVAEELLGSIHRGVNGVYHFDAAGQTTRAYPDESVDPSLAQAHLVYQIQDGRQRIVSPVPYAESGFRMPPWTLRSETARQRVTGSGSRGSG